MSEATNKPARFRFPAARRLKLSREFKRVREEGRTVRGGLLMFGVLAVESGEKFRVGLVTSRRLGGAAVRNRVRRRLREIVRRNQHALSDGIWIVIVARPTAADASFEALEEECLRLAKRAGLLRSSASS